MNVLDRCRFSKLLAASLLAIGMMCRVAIGATFMVTSTNDTGDGSLRWAITNANATAGADLILFSIPGTNVQVITPSTSLPAITEAVVIDGFSQPGSSTNTLSDGNNAQILVEISGAQAGAGGIGLSINAPDCTVRGLAIVGFSSDAIRMGNFSGGTIVGNFLGLDADRTTISGNGGYGIDSTASNVQIGGTTPDVANVILGNVAGGINLTNAANNTIQGNYIGAGGSSSRPFNEGVAITITGPTSVRNQIGGTVDGAGNVIGANAGTNADGIYLYNCSSNVIQGNWIGTDQTGTISYGNTANGIQINSANKNVIGGIAAGAGNVIAFNAAAGVLVASGTGNAIVGNSIFENAGLGIDLGSNGILANDGQDVDTGPNGLQNYPVVTNIICDGTSTTIQGTLNSTPSSIFRIEFFRSTVCDSSGYGEGKTYIGYTNVITSATGDATFNVQLPTGPIVGQYITATATDSSDNTSEFSPCSSVNGLQPPVILAPLGGILGALGTTIILSVDASGSQSLKYQWRLNGTPIPGATNAIYEILSLALGNAGAYSVVVYNSLGAAHSQPALVNILGLLQLPMADNFSDAGTLNSLLVTGNANNIGATTEPGEPLHADKVGGKSMWFTWIPTLSGIATVSTRGSSFDTLLGIYTGSNVSNLTQVASDDESGGYHTSTATFNVVGGTRYRIAVDGAGGQVGKIYLNCSLELTSQTVATVLQNPLDSTVGTNMSTSFTVDASGSSLTYQWYLNGTAISGANGWSYSLNSVTPANVGLYTVKLQSGTRTIYGSPAELQINYTDTGVDKNARAYDKLSDAVNAFITAAQSNLHHKSAPARGYSGTQIFSTYHHTQDPGEPENCGVPGGASSWFAYQPPYDGQLTIDTDGSTFDTLLGVYTGDGNDFSTLVSVACDNDSGSNGKTSKVTFHAVGGTIYYIAVDGVNGDYGTVYLHYNLTTMPIFTTNPNGGTVAAGGTANLSATVTGNPVSQYQWLRNLAPLTGQTNATLTIQNFQTANEGNYQLLASNSMGIVTSPIAMLLVNSPMRIGTLQFSNQQFSFEMIGAANSNYIMQASSDLVNWQNLATNSSPNGLWNFTDPLSGSMPLRFYRTIKQ